VNGTEGVGALARDGVVREDRCREETLSVVAEQQDHFEDVKALEKKVGSHVAASHARSRDESDVWLSIVTAALRSP
jgi:hypothetical protein